MAGMIGWFARNPVAANLLMALIIGLGAWSVLERLPLETFPAFEPDTITISAVYRGASPVEVEEAVLVRIEEAIGDLAGIAGIQSISREGTGQVIVEIEKGQDPRLLLDDLKHRIDAIITFPEDVERPLLTLRPPFRDAIGVVVYGDLPESELRRLSERVRDDLSALPEVSLAELSGVRPFEISIEVSERMLDRHGLTLDHVVESVRRASTDLPAGAIRSEGGEILLRTRGQAFNAGQFRDIPVISRADGSRVMLGEIASVRDGFEEAPLHAWMDGKPAVLIDVSRTASQSVNEVASAVKRYIEVTRPLLPYGVSLDFWRDRSHAVNLRLKTLLDSAWQGGLLVFICLALFLRFSVAVWVCVGIPLSFMGALALMPQFGITINLMSMFAFILVLGIVVDDAIITSENIYSRLRRAGPSAGVDDIIEATREVSVPVTFGLLTTVVAFLPLMAVEGIRGQLFSQIAVVVICVLIFSWVESKLILPAHMRHVNAGRGASMGGYRRFQLAVADALEYSIDRHYQPLLARALEHRYLTLAIFAGIGIIVLSLFLSGRVMFTYSPRVQSETARATLVMQTGTHEAVTAHHVRRMAEEASRLREQYTDPVSGESVIRNVVMSVGWAGGSPAQGGGRSELGHVSMDLVPPEERRIEVTTSQIVSAWRQAIGAIPGARELTFRAEVDQRRGPIDIQITGQDYRQLREVAQLARERLAQYPGVFDIGDSFEDGKPEIVLSLRPGAELLGLSSSDLGRQVRQAFFGAEAQRIQRGRDDVRVMIRYPESERQSVATLESMRIRTATGTQVPMHEVADWSVGQGFSTIRRIDRQRAINVFADLDKDSVDLNLVGRDLREYLDDALTGFPDVRYSLEGDLKEQSKGLGSLFYGTLFALFAIYALLAIPTRSYAQPLVIMLVIPFGAIGALLGHLLLGMNLSLMSLFGMLALAGVVVNDSLVLVDWINRRRNEGMDAFEAARTAGAARFRAVMLTSLTTFAGLTPLMLEKSTQAQFLIPMAISLGFGILFATLLTLFLTPIGYLILEDLRRLTGSGRQRIRAAATATG